MPYSLPSGILVYRFGERGSGFKTKTGKILDFYKLKESGRCDKNKKLFKDPNFPPEDTSIFFSQSLDQPVEWKRPHEIVQQPKFFIGGASRFDVKQGELGNCWFLAAVANLTLNRQLFHLVVPEDNADFDSPDYNGVFHFRFWKFGKWVDVVIDDLLPTRNNRLVFMHSDDKAEFWSALLEKAYAKQHGSYEALVGGNVSEALQDFTGGVTENCALAEKAGGGNLFQLMSKAFDRSSFMGCSLDSDPDGEIEAEGPLGLIRGHAYSITDVKSVSIRQKTATATSTVQLLRIRNPWGNSAEWKGAWSDGSPEWDMLTSTNKKEHSFDNDGEFWMSCNDFVTHFQTLDICNLGPDVLDELDQAKKGIENGSNKIMQNGSAVVSQTMERRKNKKWVEHVFEGSWVKGVSAGGCRNYPDTFSLNPQYIINLTEPDDEDPTQKCTLVVSLMQKFRRKLGKDFLPIGFILYLLETPDKSQPALEIPLGEDFFKYHARVESTLKYTRSREISYRFNLSPGTYVIIPSTFHPFEDGDFILRMFTETATSTKNNDAELDVECDPDKRDELLENLKNSDNKILANSEKEAAEAFFRRVAGEDLEVNWEELQELLNSTFCKTGFQGWSKDICRSAIAMMDADRSGKLGFDEFQQLWKDIEYWEMVYKKFDTDNSGSLSSSELRNALTSSGFSVNSRVVQGLVLRYGNKDGCLQFDDFLLCAIKLKCMIEVFKERVPDGKKSAVFTIDDWVDITLYS